MTSGAAPRAAQPRPDRLRAMENRTLSLDGRLLFGARCLRLFGYGLISVILVLYLFVLTGDEVNSVISALVTHGIEVTALHNHMIHGSPELYFMHFWASDTPERVAGGLKAALDAMGRPSLGMRH
jgi:hypothetical protein